MKIFFNAIYLFIIFTIVASTPVLEDLYGIKATDFYSFFGAGYIIGCLLGGYLDSKKVSIHAIYIYFVRIYIYYLKNNYFIYKKKER